MCFSHWHCVAKTSHGVVILLSCILSQTSKPIALKPSRTFAFDLWLTHNWPSGACGLSFFLPRIRRIHLRITYSIVCFFFLWKAEKHSSIAFWFNHLNAHSDWCWARPNLKPGTCFGSLIEVAGTQLVEPSPVCQDEHQQEAGMGTPACERGAALPNPWPPLGAFLLLSVPYCCYC